MNDLSRRSVISPRAPHHGAPDQAGFAIAGSFLVMTIIAAIPLWAPSLVAVGEFSLAFLLPFVIAAWAMLRPATAPIGRALRGDNGLGLWVEVSCICMAILFAALSMLVSPEPLRAFRVILPMAYGLCAIVILARVSPLMGRRLIYALTFSGVLVLSVGLLAAQVGGLRDNVVIGYRFKGFFENANQVSLAITVFWPLLVALLLGARSNFVKLTCFAALLVLGYALFLSGTKTGLAINFATTCVVVAYRASRTGSLDSSFLSLALVLAMIAVSVPLLLAILSWANPIAFEKLNSIFVGGVRDYQSIRSRNLIWEESFQLGLASPFLGEGAGSRILDRSHSHNMILDYFRGMGVFGMMSALVLLIAVGTRTAVFFSSTWGKGQEDRTRDSIVMALHLGAFGYLIGNQISDSFSPSTAFLFWAAYLCAFWSVQVPARPKLPKRVRRAAGWMPRPSSTGSSIEPVIGSN